MRANAGFAVRGRLVRTSFGLLAVAAITGVALAAGASGAPQALRDMHGTKALWHATPAGRSVLTPATKLRVRPNTYKLQRAGLARVLALAPRERSRAARTKPLVVSIPTPDGSFQRFRLEQSSIMAPGLARKHPGIKTYSGRGIDVHADTIHADLSPLGFHASVRGPQGSWYVEPYYRGSQSLYVSYYGRAVRDSDDAVRRARRAGRRALGRPRLLPPRRRRHPPRRRLRRRRDRRRSRSPTPRSTSRPATVTAQADSDGHFDATFTADPNGNLDTHIVTATAGSISASESYQVVSADDTTKDPPTGDVLRTYRLALITDPGYAAYVGGPANVTAAKVALINRVDQVYEDDMSIRMTLIANNDLLNLNDWAAATAPNGPCGAAACFTQAQVTGCSSTTRARFVIGQIIGASNYDIGHLALGEPGGGVANLGVVGRSNKAGGCTGIPTPVGDFYAIDYVAHEMGHQFSGNHPFNGNQLNCSAGNRNASTSTEPGSGSSVMAYAGICLTDDLQPHSDPYFSQRSQQEISTYTSSNQSAINEVQTASLRHFGGGNEVQVVTFGPGYQQASTIQPLTVAIGGVPSSTQLGGARRDRQHRHGRDRRGGRDAHAPAR